MTEFDRLLKAAFEAGADFAENGAHDPTVLTYPEWRASVSA